MAAHSPVGISSCAKRAQPAGPIQSSVFCVRDRLDLAGVLAWAVRRWRKRGSGVVAEADDGDGVQGAIELSVAAAVEPMTGHPAGGAGVGLVRPGPPKAASERHHPAWDQRAKLGKYDPGPQLGDGQLQLTDAVSHRRWR